MHAIRSSPIKSHPSCMPFIIRCHAMPSQPIPPHPIESNQSTSQSPKPSHSIIVALACNRAALPRLAWLGPATKACLAAIDLQGKIGPMFVSGALTEASRHEIWDKIRCNATVTARNNKERSLTISVPVAKNDGGPEACHGGHGEKQPILEYGGSLPATSGDCNGTEERKNAAAVRGTLMHTPRIPTPNTKINNRLGILGKHGYGTLGGGPRALRPPLGSTKACLATRWQCTTRLHGHNRDPPRLA